MKVFLPLLALPLVGCGSIEIVSKISGGGPTIKGTGKSLAETRTALAATAAEFSGALQVTIRSGTPSLKIEAQKEILPHIRSEFKGGRLRVWTEGSMRTDGAMRVVYTTPSISEVQASGATTLDVQTLSGDSAKVGLSGASKAKVSGKVTRLNVVASGASEASLQGLESKTAMVEATGASKVLLGKTESLNATASGASEIRYRLPLGGPLKTSVYGASRIAPL